MAKAKNNATNTINIKSEPVQAHIGSQKWSNDDWSTIAFLIDRREIQHRFADPELRYNCIYFLIGYGTDKELVYVGQAKKRNDGESVLARLREHDKSTTEKYCDQWQWIVAVTNKNDAWSLDDLNALEHAFYAEIPADQNLNGNNPNSGGADYDKYVDKIQQIKSLVTAIGFEVFADIPDKEQIQVQSVTNDNSTVEDLQNGMARIPEIVTPDRVVKAMVDMLPAEVWNSKTTFLDPACKGGEYLREIYDRLMNCELLQSEFPDEIERSNHILSKQLYGIALSQVSLERTAKKLRGFDNNIRIIPNYIEILKGAVKPTKQGKSDDAGRQLSIQDILNKEFGREMKIDVVIGNPPYQKTNGDIGVEGTVASGESIYQLFVENATKISDIVCMITPAKWFAGNRKLDSMRKILLSDNHLFGITILDAKKIFHIIMDRVTIFCWNRNYDGKTNIIDEINSDNNDTRLISSNKMDCFIPSKIEANIVEKVINEVSIESAINSQNTFGLISKTRGYTTKVQSDDVILHYTGYDCPGDNTGYIPQEMVLKNTDYIDKYKVLYPHGCGSKSNVLTRVIMAGPNEVCTQSYIVVGPIKDMMSAIKVEKYIKTKFVRALVRVRMVDQNMDADRFRFVPVTPLSDDRIDWNMSVQDIDEKLFDIYELTDDEINYIKSTLNYI